MGTEEQWGQRNSGDGGTVGTEEQLGTEEQWAQRNSGHRGTMGTEKHNNNLNLRG